MDDQEQNIWPWVPLGLEPSESRGEFYDEIADDVAGHQFLPKRDSGAWESTEFRVGVICADGSIISAVGATEATLALNNFSKLSDDETNIYLERYFTYRMPTSSFKLQLLLGARHYFKNRGKEEVGHCLVVDGQQDAHVNFTGESCFRGLQVQNDLSLEIGVNFLTDKTTESMLRVLGSAPLREGIKLTAAYNPVFPVALSYLRTATEALLKAKKNKPIVNYKLSLRSEPGDSGIPLICATYVVLQDWGKELSLFSWNDFRWDKDSGQLLRNDGPVRANYMLLRLERA